MKGHNLCSVSSGPLQEMPAGLGGLVLCRVEPLVAKRAVPAAVGRSSRPRCAKLSHFQRKSRPRHGPECGRVRAMPMRHDAARNRLLGLFQVKLSAGIIVPRCAEAERASPHGNMNLSLGLLSFGIPFVCLEVGRVRSAVLRRLGKVVPDVLPSLNDGIRYRPAGWEHKILACWNRQPDHTFRNTIQARDLRRNNQRVRAGMITLVVCVHPKEVAWMHPVRNLLFQSSSKNLFHNPGILAVTGSSSSEYEVRTSDPIHLHPAAHFHSWLHAHSPL